MAQVQLYIDAFKFDEAILKIKNSDAYKPLVTNSQFRTLEQLELIENDPITLADWIDALLSGEYTQTLGELKNFNNQHCALGVVVQLYLGDQWLCGLPQIPTIDESWLKFVFRGDSFFDLMSANEAREFEQLIISANDSLKLTFEEIAEYLKGNKPMSDLQAEAKSTTEVKMTSLKIKLTEWEKAYE